MAMGWTVTPALAAPATVEVFSAGSLRGAVNDLAKTASAQLGIEVKPSFGGSGLLRERIEQGEHPDLLLSADLNSPRALESQGRVVIPVIAFARNHMCIVSRRAAGITATNLVDRLLAQGTRVKTSTPIADPSGDYAWSIFDRIDAIRPGSGVLLKNKAQAMMSIAATPTPPAQNPTAALFASGRVDMAITYCSASAALEHESPELTSLEVPAAFDPHPVYGMAILSNKPETLRLALFLVSEKGQAILAHNGLTPLTDQALPPQP